MNLNASMHSVKDLIRFPLQDPKWQNKLLIGSLLGIACWIIPLLPAIPLAGYLARLIRAGARNEDPTRLPEWDNWDELFMDGLRMSVVVLILTLPGLLVMFAGWGLYMGGIMVMPGLERSGAEGAMVATIFSAMFTLFMAMALGMLLLLIGGLLLPPAVAHVAVERKIGAFFRFGEWWRSLRENFGSYLVAWAVFAVVYTVVMIVTQILYMSVVLCMFVPFVSVPLGIYAAWIVYRLVGQAYGGNNSRAAVDVSPDAAAVTTAGAAG